MKRNRCGTPLRSAPWLLSRLRRLRKSGVRLSRSG